MSCGAARRTLTQSESKHDPIINFTADGADTFDAGAVKIAGKWWVCGGRMGYYFRLSVPACDGAWHRRRHNVQGIVHEGVDRRVLGWVVSM